MTTPQALDAIVPSTPAAIETVNQAAAEISRLYAGFDQAAVDLTADYIQQRLAGEEEVTWIMFPRVGFMRRPTPILDPVMRHQGAILLGAGFNLFWEVLRPYQLTRTTSLIPDGRGMFVKARVITVRRVGRGYDPGAEYIVAGDQVLKAGYNRYGYISSTFRPAALDSALLEVVKALRTYEPAA